MVLNGNGNGNGSGRRSSNANPSPRPPSANDEELEIDWSLYLVTDSKLAGKRDLIEIVREALRGGAGIVQYREKNKSTREMINEAMQLRALTREFESLLIINDRLDVAMAVDADGVHVGQDDMPAMLARKLLPEGKIVGVSVKTLAEARRAQEDGADYVGVGPVYATATKSDSGAPVGVERIDQICQEIDLPVIAIGGINANNAEPAIAAGAAGVAVISAIVNEEADPRQRAAEIRRVVEEAEYASTQRILGDMTRGKYDIKFE
eukprot:tig00001221_g7591.t1